MCVLSIKVPAWKKSRNLFNDPRTFPKGVSPQVNIRAQLEFEPTYFKAVV